MNQHFGNRDCRTNSWQYAAVPDGYGSFVCPRSDTVFLQQSAFASVKGMSQMVHEWIHLGWNAMADEREQRIRFFDEAFTCYFEMRVMEAIMEEDIQTHRPDTKVCIGYKFEEYVREFQRQMQSGEYELVPISEFGNYEYGDLSYTIGAIFLHELCQIMGENQFDQITMGFLEKYRETPATLELFCMEYVDKMAQVQQDCVRTFLHKWLYTTEEYNKFL